MTEMADVSFASSEVSTTEQTNAAPPWSGMRGLMLAVLEDAVHSLRSANSLVRAEAELWMTSRDCRYVFSFAVICEAFGLEPSAVRRSVIGLLDKNATRGRLLKRSRPNVRHSGALQLGSSSSRDATVGPQIGALRRAS